MKKFILQCIQPERRLQISVTTTEMFQVSSLMYGGIALFGLLSLFLPTWPEIDAFKIAVLCSVGLLFSVVFYYFRNQAPLWLALVHIPIGIIMLSYVVYLGHAEQSVGIAIVYVISSSYLFHYVTKRVAIFFILFSMALYALALITIGVEGWQSIVVFSTGNCFTLGFIVWLITNRMHKLNTKDSLTELINRQTIDAITNDLIETNKKKESLFSFIMIDLNQFKQINDTKGHLEGDKILKQFSEALMLAVDRSDYVARWGGDEFIVILSSNSKQALKAFEYDLRKSTNEIIGFELGVSQPKPEDTLDSLMHRADENMYLNKHSRRSTD